MNYQQKSAAGASGNRHSSHRRPHRHAGAGQGRYPVWDLPPPLARRNPCLPELLEFVDTLDLRRFVSNPVYRRRLRALLDQLSDDEFEEFERWYAKRFTIN